MIPQRFRDRVLRHALSVYTIPTYPLILAVQGPPGVGKTFQTFQTLNAAQFVVFRESAAALQGKHEGDSVEAFMTIYDGARACALDSAQPSPAILIEDFDLSGAVRLQKTEYTVNQQLLVSSLMNLCDGVDASGGDATRIPIFFTGNNFSTLHQPLRRHGRLDLFTWQPDSNERIAIIESMLGHAAATPQEAAVELARLLPDASIASVRFLLDQIESEYIHKQVRHQDNLGLVLWDQATLLSYSGIPTERLLADIRAVLDALDSAEDFLNARHDQLVSEA